MGLRDTYGFAIQTAKGKFHGNAEERDGKLYWKGTVATEGYPGVRAGARRDAATSAGRIRH